MLGVGFVNIRNFKRLFRQGICRCRGHRYEKSTLSYWARIDKLWTKITEDALYCRRCGRFAVPNSRLFELDGIYPTAKEK